MTQAGSVLVVDDQADRASALVAALDDPHHLGIRRINKREAIDFTEAELKHAQHHRRKIGAADLRVGELRTAEKILLAVEPKAHTV